MSQFPQTAEGGCHCGAQRYETHGAPNYVAYCHCDDCRRATGAPAVVYVVYPASSVTFLKGTRQIYTSSPGVSRTFCGACGTPLSYEAERKGDVVIGFFSGTIDTPAAFPPQKHVFHREHVSWFDTADRLPRYADVPTSGNATDNVAPRT